MQCPLLSGQVSIIWRRKKGLPLLYNYSFAVVLYRTVTINNYFNNNLYFMDTMMYISLKQRFVMNKHIAPFLLQQGLSRYILRKRCITFCFCWGVLLPTPKKWLQGLGVSWELFNLKVQVSNSKLYFLFSAEFIVLQYHR